MSFSWVMLSMPADEALHRQDQMNTLGTVSNLLIADPQVKMAGRVREEQSGPRRRGPPQSSTYAPAVGA